MIYNETYKPKPDKRAEINRLLAHTTNKNINDVKNIEILRYVFPDKRTMIIGTIPSIYKKESNNRPLVTAMFVPDKQKEKKYNIDTRDTIWGIWSTEYDGDIYNLTIE